MTLVAQLPANGVGGALVVAGEHDHVDPQRAEAAHGLGAGGLYRVRHGDEAHEPAVLCKVEGGLAVFSQAVGHQVFRAQINSALLHHGTVAGQIMGALDFSPDAAAVDGFEVPDRDKGDLALLSFADNGLGQRGF